jgi:nucleotide-binding universal stress UspA family protein
VTPPTCHGAARKGRGSRAGSPGHRESRSRGPSALSLQAARDDHDAMDTTWIVGLDGSTGASRALRWAVERAQSCDERVLPVATWHVPLPIAALSGRRAIDVDRAGLQAEVGYLAGEAIAQLQNAECVDEPRIVEGHPAPVLRDLAGSDTAIVVGRRGISALKHRLLGSVSQYLATHAPGPVVVVPDEFETGTLQRIVVGFDGSDNSAAALRWAISIAPIDADIEALIAIDVIPWLAPETVVERHPDAVADARERILAAAEVADPEHRASRNFVLHGPRKALAEALVDADLVVVGPRGIGGIARALLGSVTTWLLHDAPCPIAVIPSD